MSRMGGTARLIEYQEATNIGKQPTLSLLALQSIGTRRQLDNRPQLSLPEATRALLPPPESGGRLSVIASVQRVHQTPGRCDTADRMHANNSVSPNGFDR
jgi:hypothetical protein